MMQVRMDRTRFCVFVCVCVCVCVMGGGGGWEAGGGLTVQAYPCIAF